MKRNSKVTKRSRRFGLHSCFICGRPIRSNNRSDEHIFPKWLLRKYNLWEESIYLLNRTNIKYNNFTVPACISCNTNYLSKLEQNISTAVDNGIQALRQLNPIELYLWAAKIYFGILYKEYLLPSEISNKNSKSIIPRDVLVGFDIHQLCLQAVHTPIEFAEIPGSIYTFAIQKHQNIKYQFDYTDSFSHTLSIRMGNVGLIVSFNDGGLLKEYMDIELQKYKDKELHPIQFAEITAQFVYFRSLLDRSIHSITIESENGKVLHIPRVPGFSLKPWFREWKIEEYAKALSIILHLPMEMLYYPPCQVMTWLEKEDHKFNIMDVNDGGWPFI